MGLVLKISLRNLLRQKRRNFLLGLGITVGTALFVLASAFAEGVSDTLFNRIIVNVVGHVSIVPAESGKRRLQIVRDLPRFKDLVRSAVPDLKELRETAAVFCRVVGNGKSESTVLIVSQRINTILNADQIIVLDDGRIAGRGTHRDLLGSCPLYREIASSQLSAEELS